MNIRMLGYSNVERIELIPKLNCAIIEWLLASQRKLLKNYDQQHWQHQDKIRHEANRTLFSLLQIQLTVEEFILNTLRTLIFAWIIFHVCRFCHILRVFIFVDGEILIILRGFIFAVARYVIFMSSMIIAGKKYGICTYWICTNWISNIQPYS